MKFEDLELTVAAASCEVSYASSGEGIPIVLLHGMGGSKVVWNDLAGHLGGRFSLIAYDLRGFGRTREIEQESLSLKTWANDLRAVLAALEVPRAVVVGHSLGASIALRYALMWPESVAALVLIGADAQLARSAPQLLQNIETIERIGFEGWVAEYWDKNPPFSAHSALGMPDACKRYREVVAANSADGYVRSSRALAELEDLTPRLEEIVAPTLVLIGSVDQRTPPEYGWDIVSRMPNAEGREIAGVGHIIQMEAPEESAMALRDFLEERDPEWRGPNG